MSSEPRLTTDVLAYVGPMILNDVPHGPNGECPEPELCSALIERDIRAVAAYRADLEAKVRALGSGTICRCGRAKDYHRPSDRPDHTYEPRYPADSISRAAVLRLLTDGAEPPEDTTPKECGCTYNTGSQPDICTVCHHREHGIQRCRVTRDGPLR